MKKTTAYIALSLATLAASCSSDQLDSNGTDILNGNGDKTPINITAGLGDAAAATRAAIGNPLGGNSITRAAIGNPLGGNSITRAGGSDEGFAQNAKLLVYLRHTTGAKSGGVYPVTTADQAPRLVSLTCKTGGTPETSFDVSYTNTASGTTTQLFWDDFSNSASADTDLRTAGHGLQSYYGYCFNGGEGTGNAEGKTVTAPAKGARTGNISAALNETTGVLGWSVPQTQNSAELLTKADLLWSAEQDAVTYAHADKNVGGDHRTINIPFSHAMSKITINVIAGEGYTEGCLGSTKVQITDFNTTGTFTAPSQEIEATASGDVTLFGDTETKNNEEKPTRAFTAMTVPHTNLSVGNTLATITDVAGNNYTIPVTQGIIDAWLGQLVVSTEDIDNGMAQAKGTRSASIEPGKGWITKPGVNYVLNVTIAKTKITLSASLKDWDYVYAEAEGKINFAGDVTEKGAIATELQTTGFDVYKNTVNTSFTEKSTTLTYADSKWSYAPAIYWQKKDDNEFFRAIAPAGTTLTSLQQGTDYLWGTSGNTAISPRTGDVPLDFEHAMSKITVQLETSSDASAVNLTGAQISISNLSTAGSISLVDGAITPSAAIAEAISLMAAPITGYAVIPQTIADEAFLQIRLADGTTYKVQLNTCVDSNSTEEPKDAITQWLRGKHYTYTIHLEKEKITFRAKVKDWVNATGSGNANLEWD